MSGEIPGFLLFAELLPSLRGTPARDAETTWTIEVLFRGEWKPFTSNLTTRDSADDSYQAAIAGSPGHAFRLVRSDTIHTLAAEHDPGQEAGRG